MEACATSQRDTRLGGAISWPARRALLDVRTPVLRRHDRVLICDREWLTVVRWVLYVVGLAAFVGTNVAALGEFHGRLDVFVISLAVLLAVVLAQSRRFESESRDP